MGELSEISSQTAKDIASTENTSCIGKWYAAVMHLVPRNFKALQAIVYSSHPLKTLLAALGQKW